MRVRANEWYSFFVRQLTVRTLFRCNAKTSLVSQKRPFSRGNGTAHHWRQHQAAAAAAVSISLFTGIVIKEGLGEFLSSASAAAWTKHRTDGLSRRFDPPTFPFSPFLTISLPLSLFIQFALNLSHLSLSFTSSFCNLSLSLSFLVIFTAIPVPPNSPLFISHVTFRAPPLLPSSSSSQVYIPVLPYHFRSLHSYPLEPLPLIYTSTITDASLGQYFTYPHFLSTLSFDDGELPFKEKGGKKLICWSTINERERERDAAMRYRIF